MSHSKKNPLFTMTDTILPKFLRGKFFNEHHSWCSLFFLGKTATKTGNWGEHSLWVFLIPSALLKFTHHLLLPLGKRLGRATGFNKEIHADKPACEQTASRKDSSTLLISGVLQEPAVSWEVCSRTFSVVGCVILSETIPVFLITPMKKPSLRHLPRALFQDS